ncbi:hypothetical protein EYV94_16220 [Puteibacter caeruleilacunae]|nr:hypothetical protein EYV94_16220 [Puteibacter caeruleilacunae]
MHCETKSFQLVMEGPGTEWRVQKGLEGMTVAYVQLPAGTDFRDKFKGLPNDHCHCPHWGYVLEGEVNVKYDNGDVESIPEGCAFYLPPGHTAWVDKDTKLVDFSPEDKYLEVLKHITGKEL